MDVSTDIVFLSHKDSPQTHILGAGDPPQDVERFLSDIDVKLHETIEANMAQTVLNPHKAPPKSLKIIFKTLHSLKVLDGQPNLDIVDFRNPEPNREFYDRAGEHHTAIFHKFLHFQPMVGDKSTAKVYNAINIPGLTIFPDLLPAEVQRTLLDRLFHRDLSNPKHQTNLHMHYNISYPENNQSFFTSSPSDILFHPKDPKVHRKLEMKQVLNKKLRWVTLGGQYDWTKKLYPAEPPPEFPNDIADLVRGLCIEVDPQAAITNVYSPGDTLSLHRDVSEEVDAGLASISLGCDCLFMIGVEDESSVIGYRYNVIRLHSGDVLYMEKEARFAWHGVPKIIPDTCPVYLAGWPNNSSGSEGPFPHWADWMKNKRVNLNVRQMRESTKIKNRSALSAQHQHMASGRPESI